MPPDRGAHPRSVSGSIAAPRLVVAYRRHGKPTLAIAPNASAPRAGVGRFGSVHVVPRTRRAVSSGTISVLGESGELSKPKWR